MNINNLVTIREKAISNSKLAKEHEIAGNIEEACKLYILAAESLNYLAMADENIYNKETYKKKAAEYNERVQELFSWLKPDIKYQE